MSIRAVVKSLVPPSLALHLRSARDRHMMRRLLGKVRPRTLRRPLQRLLIVPSDPWTLIGALGDDAMIQSCVQAARALNPAVEVHVLTASSRATAQSRALGFTGEEIWEAPDYFDVFADLLNARQFDAVAAIGADVMDGYYGAPTVEKILATCDIAARSGVSSAILGFSFNAEPPASLAACFDRMDGRVQFNLRDEISLQRFRAFSRAPAQLVTDSAFGLESGPVDTPTSDWVDARKADGRRVIGINVHPMLIKNASESQVASIISRTAEALLAVGERHRVAWFLLPHDYRGSLGDARCLAPIHEGIRDALGENIRYLAGEHSAACLKGVAGALDGVVTGRMHLAIGALGNGVPTLCVTYQAKFEGLYRHFDLPDWLLLTPDTLLEQGIFADRLSRFLNDLDAIKEKIAARLPMVKVLTQKNFESFN